MTNDALWLDSSIIRMGIPKLRALVELADEKRVPIFVHPHIHLEMCRYLRERRRESFSERYINESLEELGISIADFTLTKTIAEAHAAILHQRYPTPDAWKAAKLSSVRARLPDNASVKVEKVPMTTDWWVALEVERLNGYIAVEDKGDEWSALRLMEPCRALSYEACMNWLRSRDPAV